MPRGPSIGFNKPLTPSPELARIIDPEPRSRSKVVQDIWTYLKAHNRQDPTDKRILVADDKLRPIFGTERVSMFELAKLLGAHLRG